MSPLPRFRKLLYAHRGSAALELYRKVVHFSSRWELPESEHCRDFRHVHN